MKEKWLDDIKDRVSDFEMETPDGLWDSIENEMAADVSSLNSNSDKKTLNANWKRFASIAAAIAFVFGVCLTSYFAGDDEKNNITELSGIASDTVFGIDSEFPASHIIVTEQPILAQVSAGIAHNSFKNEIHKEDIANECNSVGKDNSETTESGPEIEKNSDKAVKKSVDKEGNHDEEDDIIPTRNDLMAYSDVSVGAFTSASGIVGSIPAGHGNNLNFGNGSSLDYGSSNGPDTRMGGLKLDGFELPSVPSYMVFEHKLPVKVGMDVSWHINRLLALQAGLSYTYLKSDIRYGGTYSYGKAIQQLHYVGIPISIRYIPFQWKKFNAYISAGVILEKCIDGKIGSDSTFGVRFAYDGMNERPFQISANAALGLQYDITKICGVFVEPGLSYYFDDGTSLRTIYKDHPVNFNLNIGLRFSLPKTE